jgi:hypothetical protein
MPSFWLVGPYHTIIDFEDQDVIQPLLVMGTYDDSCHHVFFQLQGIKITQKIIRVIFRIVSFSLHLDGNSLLMREFLKKKVHKGKKQKKAKFFFSLLSF